MSLARIKEKFIRLPRHIKFIGIGGLILAISTVLPWYADLDTYRIGDQFLGITGPASFVGIVILLLSAVSLWVFSYHLLERKVPRLPVREAILHLFVAIESLFLLLLVNSVFFHPKFGVNITLKESRFGMTLAVIGSIVLLIGAYMQNREQIREGDEIGKLEPLIKIDPVKREQPAEQPKPAFPAQISRPAPSVTPIKPVSKHQPYSPLATKRGFMFGEAVSAPKTASAAPSAGIVHEPVRESIREPEQREDQGSASSSGGSYMHRMDL